MTKGLQNPGLFPCGGTRFRPVIPDIFNRPVIPDVFNPLLSFPTFLIGNPRLFPMQDQPKKGQKSKTLDSR